MRRLSPTLLLLLFALGAVRTEADPPAPASLRNGAFEQGAPGRVPPGWFVPPFSRRAGYAAQITADGPSGGRQCAVVYSAGPPSPAAQGGFGNLMTAVDATPFRGRRVRLRARVRAAPASLDGRAQVWMRVDRPGGRTGFFDNMGDRPIADPVWRTYDIVGDVAPDAQRLALGLMLLGRGRAWVDDVSLSDLGPTNLARVNRGPLQSLDGPGLLQVSIQAAVAPVRAGASGLVTFPIPGLYREQAPLSFRLRATPPGALRGARWRRRPDGLNWLCEVSVSPPAKGVLLRWDALVLVGERPVAPLPHAARPQAPAEAAAWTRATACVQSDDPQIRAQAALLATGDPDVETYARRVMEFCASHQGRPGVAFDALDARKALDCGGSCTSRANLAAALLRARGIPARTLAHMPAWTGGHRLYEHWLVEYWHPGAGWVWLESTRDEWQPSPTTLAVLAVSRPEDEDRAFDPVHLHYVMPGAAYLSVCELSPDLKASDLLDTDATNIATPAARLSGTPAEMAALWAAARTRFARLSERARSGAVDQGDASTLLSAARSGHARALSAALTR